MIRSKKKTESFLSRAYCKIKTTCRVGFGVTNFLFFLFDIILVFLHAEDILHAYWCLEIHIKVYHSFPVLFVYNTSIQPNLFCLFSCEHWTTTTAVAKKQTIVISWSCQGRIQLPHWRMKTTSSDLNSPEIHSWVPGAIKFPRPL